MDEIPELNEDGIKTYQELIGVLIWTIEMGRVDILLEVELLSTHLAMPRKGHLEQVYHIFGYLNQISRRRLFFDPEHLDISEERFTRFNWEDVYKDEMKTIPLDMPNTRGEPVSIHVFIDSDHAGDKVTRQ